MTTLVNDVGATLEAPCTGPLGSCTLEDYAAWRRLAVELRQSVLDARVVDALDWLRGWADPDSVTQRALLVSKADPDVDGQSWPEIPAGAGEVLGMGGASVFTEKIPTLVNYIRRGDAFVPDGDGTRGLRLARTRKPGEPSQVSVAVWSVAATVVGGVLLAGILAIFRAARPRRERG